jgi:hypothetical protein
MASLGHFEGSNAVAFSGGVRVHRNVQIDAGVGIGFDHSTVGARVSVTFGF